jgi:hypothetical protein
MLTSSASGLTQVEVEGVAIGALEATTETVEQVLRQHSVVRLPSGTPPPEPAQPDLVPLAGRLAPLLAEAGLTLVGPRTLLLRAVGSRRVLRFQIGPAEADAIAVHRQRVAVPRPMSHDLMKSLLEATGTRVKRVVITRPDGETYRATVALRRGRRQPTEVDARPSDAVNLALRTGAPILVDEGLLREPPASEPDRPHQEAPAA